MPERDRNQHDGGNYETGGYNLPPLFSYDPAIFSELRALERGFKDARQDTKIARKQTKVDLRTQLRDLAVDLRRGRTDVRRERNRGLRDVGFQRQDVKTSFGRGNQDLTSRLDDLVRGFAQQGVRQTETANAAGVYAEGGTAAASAAARAENLAYARKPIDVERERLGEDLERDLGRLGTAAGDIRQDSRTAGARLRQDVHHDEGLAERDAHRVNRQLRIDLQRKNREFHIGSLDLVQQAIFNARQNSPGSFSKYGNRS